MTRILVIVSLALVVLTAGCARSKNGGTPKEHSLDQVSHRQLEGSLEANAIALLDTSSALDDCDRRLNRLVVEMGRALDRQAERIRQMAANPDPSSRLHRVPFGPMHVREFIHPQSRGSSEWDSEVMGWEAVYAYYSKIKDHPDDKRWIALNSEYRFDIVEDQDRLDGKNFFLDQDSAPLISQALGAVRNCLDDNDCETPDFGSTRLRAWVRGIPLYAKFLAKPGRGSLEELRDRLEIDHHRYEFKHNETIRRVSRSELELPLVAGSFDGYEREFAHYVQDFWSTLSLQLIIRWHDADASHDLYKILVGSAVGARPYVSYDDRVVRLFEGGLKRTILHEMGHVLGFRDHYYSVWNPANCAYDYRSRGSDIMSNSTYGGVTPQESRELDEEYPVP
jgi:hypothetical protein